MAKTFSELQAKMSPAAKVEAARVAAELLKELPLRRLRQALKLSAEKVATVEFPCEAPEACQSTVEDPSNNLST